jgi:predicted anti-sigma-YlaC factor YlaD
MFKCREVSRMIASDPYRSSGILREVVIRLHLLMCKHCRRYSEQLTAIGAAAREFWSPSSEDSEVLEKLEERILVGRFGLKRPKDS